MYMDGLSLDVNSVYSLLYVDDNCQISYGFIVLLEITDNLSRAVFPFFLGGGVLSPSLVSKNTHKTSYPCSRKQRASEC